MKGGINKKMETNAQQESEKEPKVKINLLNLGTPNKNKVVLNVNGKGTLTLFFSYETIVSFIVQTPTKYADKTIINLWSNTTGKLLNELCPNKADRIGEEEFKNELAKAFNLLF